MIILKCQNCNSEITSGTEHCYNCGCEIEINLDKENLTCEEHNVEIQKEHTEGSDRDVNMVLSCVGTIAFWIIILLVIYHKWFIPSFVPKQIWNNRIENEAYEAVEDYLIENGFDDFRIEYISRKSHCEKYQPDNILSEMFSKYITDNEKAYQYIIDSSWKVHINGVEPSIINAQSSIICHPKLLGEYQTYAFTECHKSKDLEQKKQTTLQKIFDESIKIDKFVKLNNDYSESGGSLAIYLTWKNNTTKTTSPSSELVIKMYQNGVGLQTDYVNLSNDTFREVLPGASVSFFETFELIDLTTPVDVVITSDSLYSENNPKITRKVNLINQSEEINTKYPLINTFFEKVNGFWGSKNSEGGWNILCFNNGRIDDYTYQGHMWISDGIIEDIERDAEDVFRVVVSYEEIEYATENAQPQIKRAEYLFEIIDGYERILKVKLPDFESNYMFLGKSQEDVDNYIYP